MESRKHLPKYIRYVLQSVVRTVQQLTTTENLESNPTSNNAHTPHTATTNRTLTPSCIQFSPAVQLSPAVKRNALDERFNAITHTKLLSIRNGEPQSQKGYTLELAYTTEGNQTSAASKCNHSKPVQKKDSIHYNFCTKRRSCVGIFFHAACRAWPSPSGQLQLSLSHRLIRDRRSLLSSMSAWILDNNHSANGL